MNLQALAIRLGVSTKTVSSWLRKGCPGTRAATGAYRFNLKQVIRWRDQNLRPPAGPSSYSEARARKEAALAELRELQLRQKKGELVTRESVQKATFASRRRARDQFQNLPARYSGLFAAESSQEKIFITMSKAIREILEELSNDQSTTSSSE